MSSHGDPSSGKSMASIALIYVFVLIAAWSGAWFLFLQLKEQGTWFSGPIGTFIYWLVLRILLWVLPSIKLLHLMGKSVREVLGLERTKAILLWGGIAGLVWGGKTPFLAMLMQQPLHPIVWDWSFITAVLYAPLVEELTFRGAVMLALETRTSFFMANVLTGGLFLAIHLPSWYLEGSLMTDWAVFASAALGILLLGWILGFVAHRSKSVAASTLTHMLNNFFQRFVS